jgi:pimeloyl-ACP methyl ester carboxylesterase
MRIYLMKENSFGKRVRLLLLRTGFAGLAITAFEIGGSETARGQGVMTPAPVPVQAPAKEGYAQLKDTKLFYWDTGGEGQPIILLHPNSGSALIWAYQQPVFAKAGYRVIAYSRRGYYNSAPIVEGKSGNAADDLLEFINLLGIRKFHAVAAASGGSTAAEFAATYPDRLFSLTVSSNTFGIRSGPISKAAQSIRPKNWDDIPSDVQEVGASYRAANPEGLKLWIELEHKAWVGSVRGQGRREMTEAKLEQLKVPVLLISGAADLLTPPSISRMLQSKIPNSELVVAPESGHSVYWEQPDVFNKAVLNFIGQHGK